MTDTPFTSDDTPRAAELRHELRTPVNHIIGYAEMLLEDLDGGAPQKSVLEDAVSAARGIIDLIDDSLPSGASPITKDDLSHLFASLKGPQGQIIAYMSSLLPGVDMMDEQVASDIKKIIRAAEKITEIDPTKIVRTAERLAAAQTAPVAPVAEGPDESAGSQILIVDDVEENRDVLERRLKRAGYTTHCVEDGESALGVLQTRPFDLVLLDVLMPGLDGYEVLGRIKSDDALCDIPVIMISAIDDMPSIVRCIERGAEDYLPKPFDPVLLRARISASLEKKRLRDQEKEYLRQVGHVIEAAIAVENDTYDADALSDVSQRSDELGRLARVFDGMAGEIKAREDQLKTQVDDLRQEIEMARERTGEYDGAGLDRDRLEPGQRFAERYEIAKTIGSGGMGTVYLARDLDLDELVAIKTLRPEFLSDATLIDRFKSEIRLARRISHRNVVRTHDLGDWKDIYFLTMEYVEGITVRDLLTDRKKLGVSSALAIGRQLADSLEVAHEAGIIHRDIKPQNLLLDTDGVLKVMDFGVARLAEAVSSTTEVGLVVGTPLYMPPEQLMSEEVDERCDLYAAGVVLYECLTGELPHQAKNTVQLIAQVLHQEPKSPAELNSEVSPQLAQLVMDLLAKDRDDRVQTAGQMRERLAGVG